MSSKLGICYFSDGDVTDFVAPKSLYATKEDFVKACYFEFDWVIEGWDEETIAARLNPDYVIESYVRFYRIPPEGLYDEFENGCYTFSRKGRGAFPVWRIKIA